MELEKKASQNSKVEFECSEEEKPSLLDNLKNPVYRSKLLRWMCLPIGVFSEGIVDSLAGLTNLDLEIVTSTDTDKASYFLTAVNLGYLLGSVMGGVLFGKANSYFLMLATGSLAGITAIGTPYCSTFATMFVIRCATGFFQGIYVCILNAEHIEIWGTDGQALLQLINCFYATGGVIGPLMAEPFLADKDTNNKTSHKNSTTLLWNNLTTPAHSTPNSWNNVTEHTNSTLYNWNNFTEPTNSTLTKTTNVHYAFLIAGVAMITTMIPTFLVFVIPNKSVLEAKEKLTEENVDRKLPLPLNIFMVVIVFGLFFSYCCVEVIFDSFVMTFVVDQYEEVTKAQGALITTSFWASFASGRFLSIFVSKYLIAVRQLYMHLSLLIVAFSGFFVSAFCARIPILTAFTCLAGIACSAIFPSLISWTEAELLRVTGPIAAVIFIGSSAGVTGVPIGLGYLMEHMSNFWFCYCLMGAIVLAVSFFIFILCFNRRYVNRKFGKLGDIRPQDTHDNSHVSDTRL